MLQGINEGISVLTGGSSVKRVMPRGLLYDNRLIVLLFCDIFEDVSATLYASLKTTSVEQLLDVFVV